MMWIPTLVLGASLWLAPGQTGPLTLTNVRSTYGVLGPTRTDAKILPGDELCISFEVQGMRPDAEGRVHYSVSVSVTDGQGNVKFKQEPREREAVVAAGGTRVQAFVKLQVGLDQPAGDYTVKVTVTDVASKAQGSVTKTYTVLPKAFGLVRPSITGDVSGHVPLPLVAEGQPFWVNFSAVGYAVDKSTGQPSVSVSLNILDASGQPALAKPFTGEVTKDVPANARGVPMQFGVDLSQAGKYTLVLVATDRGSGQTARLTLPVRVMKVD